MPHTHVIRIGNRRVFTNLDIFLSIAEEALAESQRLMEAGRRPKPHGQPGYILTLDPRHGSFRQSLIAITFSGMYLEALLYIVFIERFGKDKYTKKIDHSTYEEKLKILDITDGRVLADSKHFREARNELTHEKAIELHEAPSGHLLSAQGDATTKMRVGQEEAEFGVAFVKSISRLLHWPDSAGRELTHPASKS